MSKDNSPLLTKTQREVLEQLAAGKVEKSDERRTRSRIRDRVRSIIQDFPFLFETLPRGDRHQIFEDLVEYRVFREQKREQEAEHAVEIEDLETHEPSRRAMFKPIEPGLREAEGAELYEGIVATLALLYSGVDDREEFEHMLEKAITGAKRADGSVPLTVNVNIEVSREYSRDELIDRYLTDDPERPREEEKFRLDLIMPLIRQEELEEE